MFQFLYCEFHIAIDLDREVFVELCIILVYNPSC